MRCAAIVALVGLISHASPIGADGGAAVARDQAIHGEADGTCLAQQLEEGPPLPPVSERAQPMPTGIDAGVRRLRSGPGNPRIGGPKFGTLSGKTVYFSAGHGWYYSGGAAWTTQRGNTWGLIEDLISTEVVSQYIVDELQRMGAYVVPIRESDPSADVVFVDDEDAGFFMSNDWQSASLADGWKTPAFPITDDFNPFAFGGSKEAPARAFGKYAAWTFQMPKSGEYNVYVSWAQATNGAPDAHYVVRHGGGETHYLTDQRRHGSTWVLLGRHFFRAGVDYEVRLLADSANEADVVSADAVRIGGGPGRISRNGQGSGMPAFEEAARYSTQFLGAPSSVWDARSTDQTSDVVSRPRFAAWEHQAGEDAVYVAWHTNAPDGPRGTQSFAYGPESYRPIAESTGVAGSIALASLIHDELIGDLRAAWNPGWGDLKKYTGNFGELNPTHNAEMPAALIEVAFHATEADADALREPLFRKIAARAFAQGIAKYFAQKDGRELILPPEPPRNIRVVTTDSTTYVTWDPPLSAPGGGNAPTAYRVYLSRDGYGFGDGTLYVGTNADLFHQADEQPLYVRVAALNDGGESRPSPVVGTYGVYDNPGLEWRRVLLVYGYHRVDSAQAAVADYSARSLGTVDRLNEAAINDGSYLARLGAALLIDDQPFDSATSDAVASGAIDLAGYDTIIWLAGDDGNSLDATSRLAMSLYLDEGGRVIISGSSLAKRLSAISPSMLDAFGVAYDEDSGPALTAHGSPKYLGWHEVGALDLRDSAWGAHTTGAFDALLGVNGGAGVLLYDATPRAAAIAVSGRSVFMGFPLENVATDEARAEILRLSLSAVRLSEPSLPEVEPEGCGGCATKQPHVGGPALIASVGLVLITRRRRAQ